MSFLSWWLQSKLSLMLISIRDLLSLCGKVEPKSSSWNDLSQHNTYPSWISINLAVLFFQNLSNFFASKMPHSKFKHGPTFLARGVMKCPCGQTFKFKSNRDLKMKIRMHIKVCCHGSEDLDFRNQSSDILQHSQNRPTGDRCLKF